MHGESVIFQEEVALITGGSSGIGRATALAFGRAGARVVVSDVDAEGGNKTAQSLRDLGCDARFVRADVSRPEDVTRLFEELSSTFGRLDFAFNNAGVEGEPASTSECTEANWDRTIAINLKGVWLCMKEELLRMRPHRRGAIVNCASVAGLVGVEDLPAYVASKHGVVGLTRTAALEHAREGIRINAVCPGAIRTPMLDRIIAHDPNTERWLLESEPAGRIGEPEEVANAVLWLCSSKASFVTGQALAVDGGWVAR